MTDCSKCFLDYVKEWVYCIIKGNHEVSEQDEDKLYELGLGFYNSKCIRCGIEVRIEVIKDKPDYYNVIDVNAE